MKKIIEHHEKHTFRCFGGTYSFHPDRVLPPPLDEESFPRITSIALDVSGSCNLRCTYCAESITLPDRPSMPRAVMDQSVDALFKWAPRGAGVSIHFGSGEPLLRASQVLAIGNRATMEARGRRRPLALFLTTNGTLLKTQTINRLIKDGWNVKISIDGGVDVHDRCRIDMKGKGTFHRVANSVRLLAARIPNRFSTTSVLSRGTDPGQVFHTIALMGVRRIELVPVAVRSSSSSFALRDDDLAAYHRFILGHARSISRGEDVPVHIRFRKRFCRVLGYGNIRIPCGAGRSYVAVGSDGGLYPCFRFVGLGRFRLGNLTDGIYPDRLQWFVSGAGRPCEQREDCKSCWAAPLCGGPCFACAELLGHANGSPSDDYCSIVRSESEAAIWLAATLRKRNPSRLLSLLGVELG